MNKTLDKINDTLAMDTALLGPVGQCVVQIDYVTYPYDLAFLRAMDAYANAAGARTVHTIRRGRIRRQRSVLVLGTRTEVRRTLDFWETMMETRVQESSWVYTTH